MHKLIEASVIAAIGVLVFASLLIPVVDDATATTDTFKNDGGFYRMAEISADDTDEYTLYWEKSNTTHLLINGVDYDANGAYGSAITTVVASDSWLIRYASANNQYGYLQYFDGTTWMGDDSTTKSMEFTASGGSAVITRVSTTDQVTTKNVTYLYMYVIMPDSTDDIMKKPTQSPYVKGDSELYAMGITSINNTGRLVQISGDIDNGVNIEIFGVNDETISNVVIDKTPVAGYLDLYVINKITFDCTISGVTVNCTYNYFIVPYEITAERAIHADEPTRDVLEIMPLILIAGLIIGVLGYAVYSRIE